MTSLYDDIGPAIVGAFVTDPYFSLLAANPTLYRTTPGDPSADATTVADGTRAVSIIPAAKPGERNALPGVAVWDTDWYAMADASADVQAGDVVSDGTRAFVITQQPIDFFGFLFAPAEVFTGTLPAASGGAGFRSPLWILGLSA
jgi:hypothetical protein